MRRGPIVCAFNFHPVQSYKTQALPVPDASDYRAVLDSDSSEFEGFDRLQTGTLFPYQSVAMYGRQQSILVYLPSRTALVLVPKTLMPKLRT